MSHIRALTRGRILVVLATIALSSCGSQSSVLEKPTSAAAKDVPNVAVAPGPMPRSATLPPSAMTATAADHRRAMDSTARSAAEARALRTLGFNWSYVPAAASQIAYAPDGSLWALSTGPAGPNKSIWHLVNGTWTNVPGGASQIAVAPDGSVWAITSFGGLYHYVSGSWQSVGGASRQLAVDTSGNVFVVAAGAAADNQIWEYINGSWRFTGGYGAGLAGLPDSSLYVITSYGSLYNGPNGGASGFYACPGAVSSVAPLPNGAGFYALGYSANPAGGSLIYQFTPQTPGDCRNGSYQATNGFGVGVTATANTIAVLGTDGAIYTAQTSQPQTSPTPSPQYANTALTTYWPMASGNTWTYATGGSFVDRGATVLTCSCVLNGIPTEAIDTIAPDGTYGATAYYVKFIATSTGTRQTSIVATSNNHGATVTFVTSNGGAPYGLPILDDRPQVNETLAVSSGTTTITAINQVQAYVGGQYFRSVITDIVNAPGIAYLAWNFAQGVGPTALALNTSTINGATSLIGFSVDTLRSQSSGRSPLRVQIQSAVEGPLLDPVAPIFAH